MTQLIQSASPPVTISRQMAVVAIGGGVYGQNSGKLCLADIDLRCPHCQQIYPLAEMPVALGFTDDGAYVLPQYVEMCPHCLHDHPAATIIEVVF